MPSPEWRRYLAPAAFLLAVTIAVVLIRSGLDSGRDHATRQPTVPTSSVARTVTTSDGSTTAGSTTAGSMTTSTTGGTAVKRYWTVRAGDTFGVIATKSGVPVTQIQELNPTISSTSLHIGERVRVR
jgi:LysM repeat protein